jgi:indole-3-acetate monooxygenase
MSTRAQPDVASIGHTPMTPGQQTSRGADVVATATGLASFIRSHAAETESNRRLSPAVVDALRDAGFFRLLLPRSLGGLELDPVSYALVTEELARADSAAAWILQAGNAGDWWASRLPSDGVQEIYSATPDVLTAAAFHPLQRAVEEAGGHRITGRGPLASNVHDSEWLVLTALVMDHDQPRMHGGMPEIIAVVLRVSEAQVIDTWDSLGMRGTDSQDVVVDNVFVPARRSYRLVPHFEPTADFQGPLYRFPAIGETAITVAPVGLGVAREAISELRALAERKTSFGHMKSLRERSTVQSTLARAEAFLRSARLLFYETVGAAWERCLAGETSTLEQHADLLLAGSHAMSTAATVTTMMHRLAGTSGIYARSPLERHFRDISTMRHHGFVAESRLESVGQVYLGLPPEFPMIAF